MFNNYLVSICKRNKVYIEEIEIIPRFPYNRIEDFLSYLLTHNHKELLTWKFTCCDMRDKFFAAKNKGIIHAHTLLQCSWIEFKTWVVWFNKLPTIFFQTFDPKLLKSWFYSKLFHSLFSHRWHGDFLMILCKANNEPSNLSLINQTH